VIHHITYLLDLSGANFLPIPNIDFYLMS